ncbi:hypothetical protein PM082_016774 [Marasmius tenuissimus]|nr:hypothetical protein PM082_016774 [Marasmius tenuissimus]
MASTQAPGYVYDNLPDPINHPHNTPSNSKPVPLATLRSLGIDIVPIALQGKELEAKLKDVGAGRGYGSRGAGDVKVERYPSRPGLEVEQKIWAAEHIFLDEVMWFTLRGGNYFDFRDLNDTWIRVPILTNHLYIVPGGLFQRYVTVDGKNADALLLCKGPADFVERKGSTLDNHPVRLAFLRSVGK